MGQSVQKETADRCFTCRGTRHFAKNCPFKGRCAPAEAQGKPLQKPISRRSTSANRLQGSDAADLTPQDKVTRLREELRVAELEESLADGIPTTSVLHGSQSADNPNEGDGDHVKVPLLKQTFVWRDNKSRF